MTSPPPALAAQTVEDAARHLAAIVERDIIGPMRRAADQLARDWPSLAWAIRDVRVAVTANPTHPLTPDHYRTNGDATANRAAKAEAIRGWAVRHGFTADQLVALEQPVRNGILKAATGRAGPPSSDTWAAAVTATRAHHAAADG